MASGILGIGITALNAAQAGIRTTENNISNVNTAGYRRQETVFSTQTPSYAGGGLFGNGVAVETVRSQYSQFLDSEVLRDQTQLSRHQIFSTQASQVDKLLGDSSTSLNNSVNDFFNSTNEVANDPTSSAARQVMLASGRNLAGQVNTLYNSLQQKLDDSNQAVASLSTQINTYSKQIATLNQSISRLEGQSGQPANDLRDQRDQAIADLNKLADVTTVQQSSGELNVFIGNGQILVSGNQANQFNAPVADANDAYNLSPAPLLPQLNVSGASVTLDSSQIGGGELGGWLAERNTVLKPALANLNRIAVALGAEVNRVSNGGAYYDSASGTMKAGGNFFSGVVAQTGATTSWIGVSLSSNRLQNYNYTVSYNAGNYTVTRTPAGGPAIPAVAAGVEVTDASGLKLGFSIAAGTPPPANGDTWQLNFQDYAHTMSMQLSSTDKIAAANLVTGAAATNTGTAKITSSQVSAAATLPLPAQISLTYNGGLGQFVVAGAVPAVGNIAYTSPGPQTLNFNGMSVTLSGTPANGDVFTVNNTGPGDNSNALALAAVQTKGILDNGNTTLSGAYTQLVSNGASLASEADLNSKAYSALVTQAKDAQQSVSGVNLDEEAANLIRFQQAYQAAAKAITVAKTLFDSILAINP